VLCSTHCDPHGQNVRNKKFTLGPAVAALLIVSTCEITKQQMAHSVTQHTDCTKAFFTVRMSHGFTAQVYRRIFIYAQKFSEPFFTKIIKAQWHCVQICTEFHPYLSRNGEGRTKVHLALK
jgi:hypothetical protein